MLELISADVSVLDKLGKDDVTVTIVSDVPVPAVCVPLVCVFSCVEELVKLRVLDEGVWVL